MDDVITLIRLDVEMKIINTISRIIRVPTGRGHDKRQCNTYLELQQSLHKQLLLQHTNTWSLKGDTLVYTHNSPIHRHSNYHVKDEVHKTIMFQLLLILMYTY